MPRGFAPHGPSKVLQTKEYIDARDALNAPLSSPTFTDVPAAPTAAPGTNTTQLATTAFVDAAGVVLTADINSIPLPNALINGGFDLWQRATSQTASGYGSDDRWNNGNVGTTIVHSRQTFTLGQASSIWSFNVIRSISSPSAHINKFSFFAFS